MSGYIRRFVISLSSVDRTYRSAQQLPGSSAKTSSVPPIGSDVCEHEADNTNTTIRTRWKTRPGTRRTISPTPGPASP